MASSTPMNYQKLAEELIIYLRGKRKQRELSSNLGFSFNQVGKWESGVTQIKWTHFTQLCLYLKIPIYDHIQYFFWTLNDDYSTASCLRAIDKSIQLQKSSDKDNSKLLKKWLGKKLEPDLSEVLKIIDSHPGVLIGWLGRFLDCSKIETLKLAFDRLQVASEAIMDNPLSVYVNAALQLEAYKKSPTHDEKFLAEHATCTTQELRTLLSKMLKAGIIHFDGKKYLSRSSQFFSFSFSQNPNLRGLTKYTTDLASQRYSLIPATRPDPRKFNYSAGSVRVAALSEKMATQVGELVKEFHGRMADLLKQDNEPKTNVQVILIHSFASNINSPIER